MMASKRMVLCADDYGISQGVNQAIEELLEKKHITAISCMTITQDWMHDGHKLKNYTDRADIGLHFTLTKPNDRSWVVEGNTKYSALSFYQLWKACFLREISEIDVSKEFERQLKLFMSVMGQPPDFIDGHQHIHQLPVVRDAILEFIASKSFKDKVWLRASGEPLSTTLRRGTSIGRTIAIGIPGKSFKKLAAQSGLITNDVLIGSYNYQSERMGAEMLNKFLQNTQDGTLMYFHPGYNDPVLETRDTLTTHRESELETVISDNFLKMLASANVRLVKGTDVYLQP